MTLVIVNSGNQHLIDAPLTALAGERVFCSEFRYRRRTEIFGEGEEAKYIYRAISGAVRTYKLLPDGRRQINSFHLPGDMFGFENGPVHRFTAEAVVETKVHITRRRNLIDKPTNGDRPTTNVVDLVNQNLQHAEDHMLLLGRKTALERVVAFLIEMDQRQAHPNVMSLPMTRRDIADYLGLTIETVSRSLSILRDEKLLRFVGQTHQEVILLNRGGLAEHDS